ncbi:MAG: hypothetical protein OXG30_04530 [bacterium]|nr:hypothetical protein [bacterium]
MLHKISMSAIAALCCAVLSCSSSASAQSYNLLAPVAIATLEVTTEATDTTPAIVTLDGSDSFDPDAGGRIVKYEWEVFTEAYQWIELNQQSPQSPTATFEVPVAKLIERFGWTIEFRLTVTDSGRPAATDRDTVKLRINRPPEINIQVTANLADPDEKPDHDDNRNGLVDENEERYPFDGVVSGPGENGNAENEWYIRAATLLVLDASASSDPDSELADEAFRWERLLARGAASVTDSLPGDTEGKRMLSTDGDPNTPGTRSSETVARLPFVRGVGTQPHLVYYRLTVTDEDGASARQIVKIVISDFHDNPELEIAYPESDPDAAAEADRRAGVLAAGEDRYVVNPEAAQEGIELTATGEGDGATRTNSLVHTWSGPGVAPRESNQPGAQSRAEFKAPAGTKEGAVFSVQVEVADPDGLRAASFVELVVADTRAPTATAPDDIETSDGASGGFPESDPPTGVVELRGIGFDPDGDELAYSWEQVLNEAGEELGRDFRGSILLLAGSDTPVASFKLPEVARGGAEDVFVQLTVTDRWGVVDTDVVKITMSDSGDDFEAQAGLNQDVAPGSFVRLSGGFGSGPASAAAADDVTLRWVYKGIETHPRIGQRVPLSKGEIEQGFAPGEWLPDDDGRYHPTAGGRLKNADQRFAYFDAPELSDFNSATLVFEFIAGYDSDGEKRADTVVITVADRSGTGFFSGVVKGPHHCLNLSLGGPLTYPFDSDGDGVADTCSLDTTRRATVARQNALEQLAVLNPDDFTVALLGSPDDPKTQDVDESAIGACDTAPEDLGDTGEDLARDLCARYARSTTATRTELIPSALTNAWQVREFYSGVINSAQFCTNYSLGDVRLYPFDSDDDGVADVCSLATTRREAVARQQALESFIVNFSAAELTRHDELVDLLELRGVGSPTQAQTDRLAALNTKHASEFDDASASGTIDSNAEAALVQAAIDALAAKSADAIRYSNAVDAACRALGSQDFGDAPSALARDACAPKSGPTGQPLS